MKESIKLVYTWDSLKEDAKGYIKHCGKRQRCKRASKAKHGLLPEKKGEATKWPRASAGLWGPKKVPSKSGYAYGIHLMAMADPAAGWLVMAQLRGPPAAKRCQAALGAAWLSWAGAQCQRKLGLAMGESLKQNSLSFARAWE